MDLIRINNEHFFAKKMRADGRKFMEHRDFLANMNPIDTADSSNIIKLGDTTVLCGIKFMDEGKKSPEDLIDIVILPYPLEEEMSDGQEIRRKLTKLLEDHQIVDNESLAYTDSEGEKYYLSISIELDCLNGDGNIFDAFLLALLGTLNLSHVPNLSLLNGDPSGFMDASDYKSSRAKLKLLKCPIPVTFAIIRQDVILLDPTREEEQLANGKIKVVFDTLTGTIMLVEKDGGQPLPESTLIKLISSAKAYSSKFYKTSDLFHLEPST
ncbi:exosome complex component RRP43-like [Brevipalpus obovatus]|uniref:exosome complex component RRP43-like n=1 Tax=Brevipalpus obovatus TaxID=246614 RepID=UPI003D9E9B14